MFLWIICSICYVGLHSTILIHLLEQRYRLVLYYCTCVDMLFIVFSIICFCVGIKSTSTCSISNFRFLYKWRYFQIILIPLNLQSPCYPWGQNVEKLVRCPHFRGSLHTNGIIGNLGLLIVFWLKRWPHWGWSDQCVSNLASFEITIICRFTISVKK